ncbi:hypothetical protein QKQ66_gp023 [Dione juno nucleopolyhedrovirus]|uniref:Uncharacterized protein n=1 Tax=Dione juno nucleopolyhedrovirus TaxID=2594175 RepID=A0AAE6H325_9ABAC|nr:hypothetical protein QKQ66_gp023 [Dione juno nucleopolyhedrovirus]QDL56940.1 hypothetical protein DijuNPV-ORF-23 [Dione juno nucleopolyhedrovirus]
MRVIFFGFGKRLHILHDDTHVGCFFDSVKKFYILHFVYMIKRVCVAYLRLGK